MDKNSFEDGKAPQFGDNLVTDIRKRAPHVFLICFRSKNKHVVVYEAQVKDGKFLDPPVVGYWLILEPSYQEARKHISHDREELNYLDHKFAWGFETKRVSDKEASFSFSMFKHPMTVKISENGEMSQLFTVKDEKKYLIRQLYVEASDNFHLRNIRDNVKSLTLQSVDITNKPYQVCSVRLK